MYFFRTLMFTLFSGAVLFFTACNNKTANNENDETYTRYNKFVNSIDTNRSTWESDTTYWSNREKEYGTIRGDVDKNYQNMSEENRKRIDSLNNRYETIHGNYSKWSEDRKIRMAHRSQLRTSLFGADATDDNLNNVTAKNILSYYQKLVNTVKANKDSYSPDDWDAIKAWYEKLDEKKNQLEGNGLSTADNLKIAKLKVEYDAIRVPNRIESRVEEKVNDQEKKGNM